MTTDTQNPQPGENTAPAETPEPDTLQAHPLVPGSALGPNIISKLLGTSDSGYTYLANDGATVVQEYFPIQFAVRDTDGISLLLCDAQFNSDFEQGLTEFLPVSSSGHLRLLQRGSGGSCRRKCSGGGDPPVLYAGGA